MNVSTRTYFTAGNNCYCGSTNSSANLIPDNRNLKPARLLRWLFVFMLMLGTGIWAQGQNLGNYTYSTAYNASLEDMSSGATAALTGRNDDIATTVKPIGFNFLFMGQVYTHWSANSNGQMRLHTSSGSSAIGTAASSPSSGLVTFCPASGDNAVEDGISYKVIGTAPNRKLVIQWSGFHIYWSTSSNKGDMQVWINEGNGEVDFVYGTIYNNTTSRTLSLFISSSNTASTAGSITINTPPTDPTFGLGATPVSNSIPNNAVVPNISSTAQGSRRIFSWVPSASIAGPTSLSFSNVGVESMTLNWVASNPETGVLGYIVYASSDGGTTYNPVGVAPGSSTTSANITGLTGGTTYLWKVYAYAEGNLSSTYADDVQATNGCSITGTKTVGPTGDYASITAALTDLASQGASGPVVLELQSNYVSSVETFPVVLSHIPCMDATNTVTIRPASGATGLSITGSNATSLLTFSGSSNFIIDGRPGGTGSADLTINNTGNGPAILFSNGASNNTVQYSKILAASTSTSSGVILFSTAGATAGNNNNTVSNNDIDGGGVAANLIYSSGTFGKANTGNIISSNNFHDQFVAGSSTKALNINSYNQAWTITGNSFYQTASRTYTAANAHYSIYVYDGDGYSITNNFIGGSQSGAGGTAMTLSGANATTYTGIYWYGSSGSNISSITGNTISNISLNTNAASASLPGVFSGIYFNSNAANINNNTISSIAIVSGADLGVSAGIGAGFSGSNNSTINNNTISAINVSGSTTSFGSSFTGIWTTGSPTGSVTIDGNTIGHASNTNSIYFSSLTTGTSGGVLMGIYNTGNPTGGITISNNTVANMNSLYAPSAAFASPVIRGIYVTSGVYAVTGNTIHDLSANANATGTGSSGSVLGISITSTGASASVSQNTIYSLSNSHATSANYVTGIYWGGSATSTVGRNLIYSIYSPSTIALVNGIQVAAAGTIQNNMIRLGIDAAGVSKTTATNYNGIYATSASNIYHNTVYIGGDNVNTAPPTSTYGFFSTVSTGTRNIANNIFVNERTSASAGGKHYAIRLNSTGGTLTINANVYRATGAFTGVLGSNNGTDVTTLAAWKTFTAQDVISLDANVCLANPTAATPDLHLTDCSGAGNPADGAGIAVSTTDDYDGEDRSILSPVDIGADAGQYGLTGVNVGLSALNTPVDGGCYTNSESVEVQLNNYDINPIDFTVNPVTITVTNNHGYNSSTVINTGTLAANSSMAVTMPDAMDLTVRGTYLINGSATATGDVNPANDAFQQVSIAVSQLSGTYTVGTGGDFSTITAAVAAYNTAACLSGAVVFSLTDAAYASETFPITINNRTDASSTNTLTIKPASGTTVSLSGSNSTALFTLNGADYVTLDGSNNGTNTRDWTITNTYASGGAGIKINSATGSGNDASHIGIKNLNIVGGSTTNGYGIYSSITGTAVNLDNLTIQNNSIQKNNYGLYLFGSSTNLHTNLLITENSFGSDNADNYLTFYGIYLAGATSPVISKNHIFNIIRNTYSSPTGIYLSDVTNGSVDANNIENVQSSYTGGYGAYGIDLSTTVDGTTLSNNMISGMMTINYSAISATYNAFGIRLYGSKNIKIYHNSINMYGDVTVGSSAGMSANICLYSTAPTGLDIRDNILVNTQSFAVSGSLAYNIYSEVGNTAFPTIDYNDYYGANSANTTYKVAETDDGVYNTLADWQTATAQDAHSLAIAPVFTSSSDLHLVPEQNSLLDDKGTDVGITTDYDGDSRSLTTPDMGVDEFTAPVVLDVSLSAVVSPSDIGCYGTTESVTVTVSNNTGFPIDLSTDPVTVNVTATGGYTSSVVLNSGIIPATGSQDVTMPDVIDMSVAGTYTFNGSATISGDINTGNDALSPAVVRTSGAPAVGSISASPDFYCATPGAPTITLSSASNGNIQWQESTTSDSGPWTDVGTNALSYTPASAISGTTYYQAVVSCPASGLSVTSDVVTVAIHDPQITSTTDASRCGEGTVTLEATANSGSTVEWYDAATGGNKLGTGNSFVTPVINATTSYYAGAVVESVGTVDATFGAGSLSSGLYGAVSPFYYTWGSKKTQYLFLASELTAQGLSAGAIKSITFYADAANGASFLGFAITMGATSTGSLTAFETGGTTVYAQASVTPVVGANTYTFSTPFNWDGTSNVWVQMCWGNSNSGSSSNAVSVAYDDGLGFNGTIYKLTDYLDGSTACGQTTTTSSLTTRPQFTLAGTANCYSARTEVIATVTAPPAITPAVSQNVICNGESTDLSVTSDNDPNYTYTWTPGNLSGASQTVTPSVTTTYEVTATDNSGGANDGCTAVASVLVTVNPTVTDITALATPEVVCVGGTTDLSATANSGETGSINYSEGFESGIPGNWTVINAGSGNSWSSSTSYPHTGTGNAQYMYNSVNAANTWMITQGFSLIANVPVNITFWEKTSTFTEKLKITAGTGATVADQTTVIQDYGAHSVSTYTQRTLSFTPATSGTYYFGFNCYSDADEYYLAIDDVNINYSYTLAPTYSWVSDPAGFTSSDQNPADVSPTGATTYTVTATNSFGCSAQASVNITISDLAVSATATDVLCNGGATGTITATATGGTEPYEYSIDGTNWQASNEFTGLIAGSYTVQVRDANSVPCTVSAASVTINEPEAILVSIDNFVDPTCWLTATGSISASATGGTGTYSYTIVGPTVNLTGASTGIFTDLTAGDYTITVTDGNSCQSISTVVTLTDPAAPSVTASNNGPVCDGSDATLTATSGFTTYSWTGPGTINNDDTESATAVTPADNSEYTVTVTDANGCVNTASTTVSVVTNAEVSVTIDASPGNEVCPGATVTFTATPVNGGVSPAYQWYVNGSPVSGETASTFSTSTLNDQDYVEVELTSSIACTVTNPVMSNSITMSISGLIFADASISADAEEVCDGTQVTLTASGNGLGSTPTYDFYVNNNLVQSGSSATYTYTPVDGDEAYVMITSSFDCAIGSPATSSPVTITVHPIPAAPTVTAGGATTFCDGGSVTLTSSYVGGNTWSTSETTDEITVTTSGTYTVTQTQNGCTSDASAPVEVIVNANPVATITGAAVLCTGSTNTLSASSSDAGSGTITSYQWVKDGVNMGTDVTQDITEGGSYTVTITNSNGCSTTSDAFVVAEKAAPTVILAASCTSLYPGQTSTLTATASGGVTYAWYLDNNLQAETSDTYVTGDNAGGSYSVVVTNGDGCTATDAIVITSNSGPLAAGSYNIPSTCGGFPTIASAVNYLNANGIDGTGDVTFNVADGYSETAPASGFALTATGTATSKIIFASLGTSTINAGVGANTPSSATIDAMFKIIGGDYITINGFTFTDGNTTNPATMEAGVALLKQSETDGAQNNSILNNVFNMQRVNNATGSATRANGSAAIAIYNTTDAASTAVTVTNATGANSYNKIYGNTINGGNTGIAVMGYNASSPYDLADVGNDIGGTNSAQGNNILNYGGGGTNTAYGIQTVYQYDFNASYNSINNNNGSGVNHGGILYGIYTGTAVNASAAVTNNTISVTSGATTSALYGVYNAAGGTGSGNLVNISNNTVTTNYPGATSGSSYGYYNTAGASTVNINDNNLSLSSSSTSGTTYGFYNSGSASTAVTIDGNHITGQTFSSAGSTSFYGFYMSSAGSSATASISGNSLAGVSHTGAQTGSWYFVYKSASGNETINNNSIDGITLGTTSGSVYLFYLNNSSATSEISNNTINNVTKAGAGSVFYGFYNFSSPSGTTNIHDNSFTNIAVNGTSTISLGSSGGFQVLFWGTGSGNTLNVYNNTLSNISNTSTSGDLVLFSTNYCPSNVYGNTINTISANGSVYARVNGSSSLVTSTYNNTISGMSTTGASAKVYGVYIANGNYAHTVYGNTISGLTTSGATSPVVGGIYVSAGSPQVYKNKVTSLSATGAFTTGTGVVTGITLNGGTTYDAYNNYVGDLSAPAASNADAIRGINVAGTATYNVSYNTVYLNASSTGTNFGTSALYSNSSAKLNLRNNILVNASTAAGTGLASTFRMSSTTLTNYNSASNNNIFYAGTPSATNVIFYDGTNSDQTLANFKTRVTPRDGDSKTENPPFLSTTASDPDYLHIDPLTQTFAESGGVQISGIDDDYDGDIRYGSPGYAGTSTIGTDIGADEFDGIAPACSGANGGTASATPATICYGSTSSFSVSGASSGAGIEYQWMVSSVAGGPYTEVAGAVTRDYTTADDLAVGTYYYVLRVTCTASSEEGYSNEITLTVNPVPTASASSSSPVCSGSALNLTGTTDIGTTFAWSGPNAFSSTEQNPTISSTVLASAGDYSFTATLNGCTSEPATVSVVVNETPSAVTISPASAILCQGSTQELTASGGALSGSLVLYSQDFNAPTNDWTIVNAPTSPAATNWSLRASDGLFHSMHSPDNSQFMGADADAGGSGSTTETSLTSPALNTVGLSAASVEFDQYYSKYSADVSAAVQASTDGTNWTTLIDYTPMGTQGASSSFAHSTVPLTAPFLNQASVYVRFYYKSSWGFYWGVDNVKLTKPISATMVWSPATDLYLDAAATTPYSGEDVNTVYVKSNSSVIVTATSTNGSCSSNGTASLTINPAPAGNMASGSETVCQDAASPVITFTGTTGTAPYTFTYTVNGGSPQTVTSGGGPNPVSVTVNAPTNAAGVFTYEITNVADIYCSTPVSGDAYTVTVNAKPTVSFSGLPASVCVDGGSVQLTGTPSGGTFSGDGITGDTFDPATAGVGAHDITYSYTDGVTGCSNTDVQSVTVNALPVVSFSGLAANYCTTDASVQLTGSPAGGTFSGTGISGDTFDPATAGAGTFTITYSYTDGNGCSATTSQDVTVTVCPVYTTLNLKLYLQGYYAGSGLMQPVLLNEGAGSSSTETDNITVEIHDGSTPATVLDTETGMLNTDGTVSVQIPASVSGSHYIVIKHRNTIQTWSATTVNFSGGTISYDFSTAASQAYGSNMIEVESGVYALYTGDINQDENIDLLDFNILKIDANNFEFGYFDTDLNGDGNVDLLDFPLWKINSNNFIYSAHP